jgi:hypothetical protein
LLAPDDPRLQALLGSYQRWLGSALCQPQELEGAPFVVLAHDTQSPPILFYGNQLALRLWEMPFEDFTRMPSAETAEPDLREAREQLLGQVARCGFYTGYRGTRVSRTGRRFEIRQATVWNLLSPAGTPMGQAATFSSWRYL